MKIIQIITEAYSAKRIIYFILFFTMLVSLAVELFITDTKFVWPYLFFPYFFWTFVINISKKSTKNKGISVWLWRVKAILEIEKGKEE